MKIIGKVIESYSRNPINISKMIHYDFDIFMYNNYTQSIVDEFLIHEFDIDVYTENEYHLTQIKKFLFGIDALIIEVICDGKIYNISYQ